NAMRSIQLRPSGPSSAPRYFTRLTLQLSVYLAHCASQRSTMGRTLASTLPPSVTDSTLRLPPPPAATPTKPSNRVADTAAPLARHHESLAAPYPPVTPRRLAFETTRPLVLRQCLAEATGVF